MVQKSSKILGGYSLFLLIDMLFKMLILHAGCHSLIVSYMHTLWFKDFIFAGFSFLVENFKLKGFLKKIYIYKKGKTFLKKTSPGYILGIYPRRAKLFMHIPRRENSLYYVFCSWKLFSCLGFREISMLSSVPHVANVS